jgi:hypothetical protein
MLLPDRNQLRAAVRTVASRGVLDICAHGAAPRHRFGCNGRVLLRFVGFAHSIPLVRATIATEADFASVVGGRVDSVRLAPHARASVIDDYGVHTMGFADSAVR